MGCDSEFYNKINKLTDFISESNSIVFFGGAGVSTESGIPDFRSKDGLYNQHDVEFDMYEPEYLLSEECLHHKPKVFFEFYRQKMDARNEDIMTIKEVSQKYNISQDTLRYYERVGLIPTVARTSGGIRNYTENDLGIIAGYCVRVVK
jgi:hypothetical protein